MFRLMTLCLCLITPLLEGQTGGTPSPTDYRLRPLDTVTIQVFDEPDLSASQRLDADGKVSLPLLGTVKLSGMPIREVETFLEKRYIEEEYLLRPQVIVSVAGYNPRQFYLFGEVNNPGAKLFPTEAEYLDIIEAISLGGDFSDMARKSSVRVTRTDSQGNEVVMTWNLDGIIEGGAPSEKGRASFRVYPGDILFVPERIF